MRLTLISSFFLPADRSLLCAVFGASTKAATTLSTTASAAAASVGLVGLLALVAATLFAGIAAGISVAEHPARMRLDDRAALLQWAPSYRRAAAVQAPMALLAAVLGAVCFSRSSAPLWLLGASLAFFNIPFTLAAIMPLNQRMLAAADACAKDKAAACPADTRQNLLRWGRLHAVRTVAGALATAAYVAAMM